MAPFRVGLAIHPRRDVSPQAATIAEWGAHDLPLLPDELRELR